MNVQILSQSRLQKKVTTKSKSYNSTSLQGKTMMSDDFELGEDEMDPMSSVTFSPSLRIT